MEETSTTMHNLNRVQLKKDSNQTHYELWYGYKPNVIYLKVFGSKCYILKESRKGKFDVRGDEGIFLGHSYRSKVYTCLILSTYKIIKSAHVGIDDFAKKSEEERIIILKKPQRLCIQTYVDLLEQRVIVEISFSFFLLMTILE